MKGSLLSIVLCCFCAIVGCIKLGYATKLNDDKTNEAIILIQKKIEALQAKRDVIFAEVDNILKLDKSSGLSNKTKNMNKSAATTTEVNKQWSYRLERNKSYIEIYNDQIAISKKLFNAIIICVNIAKAKVDLQKTKAKAGKITKEYVKLAKIELDMDKTRLKSAETEIKISKCCIKSAEVWIRTCMTITDENRRKEILEKGSIELEEVAIETAKMYLKDTIDSVNFSNLLLKEAEVEADIIKTINTAVADEDVIVSILNKYKTRSRRKASEIVAEAKSYVDEYEKDLKTAKANIVFQKAKSGKVAKEDIKLAKLKLDLAKINVKKSKTHLEVAKNYIKLDEIQARTGYMLQQTRIMLKKRTQLRSTKLVEET
jgi:hypothetical protein